MKRKSLSSLAPGFRFHPTDEELVRYYLKRKVSGKPLRLDPISEIDIYKSEPWDLPDKSRLKSRDLEWYFFSALDRKYGNGSKTNRATEKGYWKTTGKDRSVQNGSRTVGMKKTLVYHFGRAPHGKRTNWVMHEYRLTDEELEKAGIQQDAYVLCRVFEKSGSGPKNGEQYGAPFLEEEWEENDEMDVLPDQKVLVDEVALDDDAQFDKSDIHQSLSFGSSAGDVLPPSSFCYGETSNNTKNEDLVEDNCMPQISSCSNVQQPDGWDLIELPAQYQMNAESVKPDDAFQASADLNGVYLDDLLDGIFVDAPDGPAFEDIPFLHTNDLSNPAESNTGDFDPDEFFKYFDAEDHMFMANDSSEMMNNYLDEWPVARHLLPVPQEQGGSSPLKSDLKTDELKSGLGHKSPEKTSSFWESLPAPPAFASEFPSKDALLQLSSIKSSQASSGYYDASTSGMLRINNMTLMGNEVNWSFSKNGKVNLCLCFQLAKDGPVLGAAPSRTAVSGPWSWLCCLSMLAVFVPLTFKLGSYLWSH
ncbi:hypothetical protein SAY86_017346 [Trapa natans]|uniref:NAC domain-containing protein n=1 Tax=Trapa natans TaxID=22666 RepID=A0AAN7M1E1_TRANT|nr:hypothetical protein SAY86_017346 [Trapa natans]